MYAAYINQRGVTPRGWELKPVYHLPYIGAEYGVRRYLHAILYIGARCAPFSVSTRIQSVGNLERLRFHMAVMANLGIRKDRESHTPLYLKYWLFSLLPRAEWSGGGM